MVCLIGLFYEKFTIQQSQQVYHTFAEEKKKILDMKAPRETEEQTQQCWTTLQQTMPNLIAWIEGAGLDYPVVQGSDNQYYLTHLPDGTYNALGSVFLDAELTADFSQPVSILYAHSAKAGNMFGALTQYKSQSFYQENPVLFLSTPEKEYKVTVLAAYLLDAQTEYYPKKFQDEQEFREYLNFVKKKSYFKTEETAQYQDKLLILSTCAYDFEDARLAVVGRLDEA